MADIHDIRNAIKDYIMENGREYERLLISKEFYEKLKEETSESAVDFPRMEIKSEANYDFKLLP